MDAITGSVKESGDGTADEYKESTQNTNHGQGGEGNSLFVPTRVTGKIGYGQDFNNSDSKYDLIDVGDTTNDPELDITGNQITLEAWIQHNITPQGGVYYGILNHKGYNTADGGYRLLIPQLENKIAFQLPGDSYDLVSATEVSTGGWHHIVATYDGITDQMIRIYIDGIKDTNELSKSDNILSVTGADDAVWIGHGDQPKDVAWSLPWEGQIDEVRISNIARSGDWIAAQHDSMTDNFATYGTEEDQITGDIYLALCDANGAAKNLETYLYDESARSWSTKTNVLNLVSGNLRDVKVSIDENTGDVYVVYEWTLSGVGHVYYQKSTDGMSSWLGENQVSTTAENRITEVRPNLMSGHRLYAAWYMEIDPNPDFEIRGETILDNRVTETWGENSSRDDYTGVTEDTHLSGNDRTDYNEGANSHTRAGDLGSRPYRTMIKSDFSAIPISDSSQIVSAYLKMRSYDNPEAGNIDLDAFRVKKHWNEGNNDYAPANIGEDEVTWSHQYYNTDAWIGAGCDNSADRETTADDTQTISSGNTWYTWDVTNSVKTMFDNNEYYGWILISQSEGTTKYWRLFSSDHATASYRPYLEITYDSIPSPSLTLADHSSGQVGDKFTDTTPVTDTLFQFKLTRTGTVTVDNLRVNFTTGGGVVNGDVSGGELWEDTNGNGTWDDTGGGDTLKQGGVTPNPSDQLPFTTNFTPGTSGTTYFVRATVSALTDGDTTTLSVGTADIDEVEGGGVPESGSISNATHTQDSAGGSLLTKFGTFAASETSVTGIGFQPKAVLFWITDRTSAGSSAYARFGRGWAAYDGSGYTQGTAATAWNDSAGSSSTRTRVVDTNCITLIDMMGTLLAEASIVSLDANGFTINWSTAGGSRLVTYLALGGSALSNVKAGGFNYPATIGHSETGVGFQPDAVLFMGNESDNSLNTTSTRGGHGFGIGISTSSRHSDAHRWRNGDTSNASSSGLDDSYCLVFADDSTTPEVALDLVSLDADGFTVTKDLGAAIDQPAVIYLAMKGIDIDRGVLTQPTGTGNQPITGLSFEPSAVLFDGGDKATVNGFEAKAEMVAGVATSSSERASFWIGCDSEVSPYPSDTDLSTSAVIRSLTTGTPTLNAQADFVSMNSDGFTINWTTADSTQRKIGWIALGPAQVPVTATKLVFTVEPSNTAAEDTFLPAIKVEAQDDLGVTDTNYTEDISIAILNNPPGDGALSGTTTVAAVSGVATFSDLSIDKVGAGYTLQATSGSLTAATSASFNITAIKLVFTVQPTNTASDATITPAIEVAAQDNYGNTDTTYTADISIIILNNPLGTGALSGTTTVAAVSGVATFSDLSIDKAGVGYTLRANSGSLTQVTSASFNVTASKLVFTVQPSNTRTGATITPAIEVAAQDNYGNTDTSYTGDISMAIDNNPPGDGALSGTTPVAAVSGVATFSDLSIDKAGAGYTLQATATGLTSATSTSFNITSATKLVFTVQPSDTKAEATIAAITVEAQDDLGTTDTIYDEDISIAILNNPPGDGALSGTTPVAAVNGVATFSDLSIDKVGAGYTLQATSGSLTADTSVSFNITAIKLVFTVQPTNTEPGATITPAIEVAAQDNYGNTDTTYTADVSIAILNNPGSGTLSGTTPVAAVSGVATFSDLSIDNEGDGYTLQATATGLTSATSAAFNISLVTATKLVFTVEPSDTLEGNTIITRALAGEDSRRTGGSVLRPSV